VNRFRQRVLAALAFIFTLVTIGTIGFVRLPGWSFSDAVFMTVITLSAVGYQEVHPLDEAGRALATFLIFGGLTALGVWFAIITSAIVEMDLAHTFRRHRTMNTLRKMKNHIVVCGAGRMGSQVVKELVKSHIPYVAIERDADQVEVVREIDEDAPIIEADATHDETLVEAGIGRARGLVAALSADTDNLFVCLTARDLQPGLTIVTRAYDQDAMSKLRKAGADHVISPNISGGIRMASMLLRPQVMSFLDVVTRGEELELLLEQVPVPKDSPLDGHTLAEAQIPQKTGLVVLAIKHGEERREPFIYNPGPNELVRAGDVLIVLGKTGQIDSLRFTLA
jgi:voltage-gated potassium channel